MELLLLEEVDSTNEYLKRVEFRDGFGVTARLQTGGKGRRGRSWLSLKDKGIYLSVMFSPLSSQIVSLSSLAFGVAVCNTLRELDARFYLKWPNDIYINGKKVSGILPENLSDRLIVGIGVNLTYTEEELRGFNPPATSLFLEGISFRRGQLIEKLWKNVNNYYARLKRGEFSVKEFEELCPMIGKRITVIQNGETFSAIALGVDREGALIVEREGKIYRLLSAEVSVREG